MELPLELDFQMQSADLEPPECHSRGRGRRFGLAAQPGGDSRAAPEIHAETGKGQDRHPAGEERPQRILPVPALGLDTRSALNQTPDLEGKRGEVEVVANAENPPFSRTPGLAAGADLDHGLGERGVSGEQEPGDDRRSQEEPPGHAASILAPLRSLQRFRSLSRPSEVETLPDRITSRLAQRSPRRLDEALRGAAVLVPLVQRDGGYALVLTRRAADLRRQPGDIAFPGGMMDPEDSSELAAALREGREEIGLDPGGVRVLGQLDDRLTVQRFRLVPFVALIPSSATLRAGPEVDEIFEVPLSTLLRPDCETTEVQRGRKLAGGAGVVSRVVFRYRYRDYDIWGLTARIIRDLLDVL